MRQALIDAAIDGLAAGGLTDIAGGLTGGLSTLDPSKLRGGVTADQTVMLLLTDGKQTVPTGASEQLAIDAATSVKAAWHSIWAHTGS